MSGKTSSNRLSPEHALLGFLFKHPSYGYELHQRLSAEFGNIWHASQSQTYTILKRLAAQRCITSVTVEQEKLPARQLIHITGAGRRRFDTWLKTPTGCSVHAIRVEFITRLYFYQEFYPEAIQGVIAAQTAEVSLGVKKLEENLAGLPEQRKFDRLGLALRIRQLNSILEWLMECSKELEPKI